MIKTNTKKLLILALSLLFAFSLISFVVARPVSADTTPTVTMKETAEVRYEEVGDARKGIRFTGFVDKTLEFTYPETTTNDLLATDKFAGIIVGRGEYLAEELTIEDDVMDVPAARWDPSRDTDTQKAFNTVIYNIPSAEYGQVLTARAYYYDGAEYTYSDNVCVRSIAQVASAELVAGGYTDEQELELQAYVKGAKPVLSIGETTLVEGDAGNDITIMASTSATITVEPANIAFKVTANQDATNVTVDGYTITAGAATSAVQTVMVDVGGVTYYLNVTISNWKDTDIATGVYAAYDEAAYVTTFDTLPDSATVSKDAGAPTYLDAETAKAELGDVAEAQNGVIKWEKKHHAILRIYFQQPVVKATSEGLVIRLKTDMETNTLYEHTKVRLEGDTTAFSTSTTALYSHMGLAWRKGYLDTVDKWVELVIPGTEMRENANWPAELNYIDIYYTDFVGGTVYIDEIFDLSVWSDKDIGEYVYAAYDEANYAYTVEMNGAGTVTYLDAETAKTELGDVAEAQNGVIKLDAKTGWKYIKINFQKPVDMSTAIGFTIRFKSSTASKGLIKVRLPGADSHVEMYSIEDLAYADREYGYTANEWYSLNANLKAYAESDTFPAKWEYIEFYICAGGQTLYLDEVTGLNDAPEGYLADFDDSYDVENYVYANASWYKSSCTIETGVDGAEGGVLAYNTVISNSMNVFPQRAVNGNKVSKIILRVFIPTIDSTDETYQNARINIAVNSTATNGEKSGVSLVKTQWYHNYTSEASGYAFIGAGNRGQWVELTYNVAGKLSNRPIDRISINRFGQAGANAAIYEGEGAWYLDWIKYELAE
ncbi:MAG: hypothetical protein IJX16_01995 [Clostridia bacterium]|nr:hypothetical protein [Clostridia bacterium]